ncbi:unnamed protein product, partial [Discosporangium mesarthrocarpum]
FTGGLVDFQKAIFSGGDTYFDEAKFDGGNALFSRVNFSGGDANFKRTRFDGGSAAFDYVKFSGGDAYFVDAHFTGGGASFFNAQFDNVSSFFEAKFRKYSYFTGAAFKGPISLIDSHFAVVPDFRQTAFTMHFTCDGIKVAYIVDEEREWGLFRKAYSSTDADKFRRLKELAVQARDHEREQDFFAKELKAKRFYETTGLSLIPSYLYEWTSDFGRSLWRPILCLGLTWLIFGM